MNIKNYQQKKPVITGYRTLFCFFGASLVASLGIGSSGALAQAAEEQIDEIFITGSRIARDPNLAGPLPVQSVGAEQIRASGEFNISDVVNDVPALLNSMTSEQSIDTAAFYDGANVLNLRGLGTARTLTLVDGRRHVGGQQGSSSVDVGSIPMRLVDRVEVLTGGASAIYGADAVTGVVNFILKDDFEGFTVDVDYGISSRGDGRQVALSGVWGSNFADGAGNIAIAVDYRKDQGLQVTDRKNGHLIGSSRDWTNPDRRFQIGDIAGDTPNFEQYYDYFNTGLTNYGLSIPTTAADFISDYQAEFGMAPTLSAAELALIDRAANAPSRAVRPAYTFPFTSGYGYVIPGNPYTFDGFDPEEPVDLNNNGIPDCLDSWSGYNSSFAPAAFGAIGGCWNVQADGTYLPVQDGLVAGTFQGFGGDSFNTLVQDNTHLSLPDDRFTLNFIGHYDLTSAMRLFGELKYSASDLETESDPSSFWDLLFGAEDNPFLPAFLQPIAAAYGGVAITPDPIGFGSMTSNDRETTRLVLGIEGAFNNGWDYEVSGNIGKFTLESRTTGRVIVDRFFAAIDAVTDPLTLQPACRIEVDPGAPLVTTPFDIPPFDPGYYSFTPGAGDCVPLDIWNGQSGYSNQAALDFVTTTSWDKIEIEQKVLAAVVVGDMGDLLQLPGGAIGFATGVEYRTEKSTATFDEWQRGVIPAGSPFAAGTLIEDVSDNSSLVFRPEVLIRNEVGEYDATDVFFEVSLPLLSGMPLAEELTLDMAVRASHYSTIGDTATWKANLLYSPISDLAIRAGISQAVRAPNITELFSPLVGSTFRPVDPCDAGTLAALAGDPATAQLAADTQANCVADFATFSLDPFDGLGNYVFTDPLSAAFGGVVGGNPDLTEETADTVTLGFVYQPAFLPGFAMTLDYWSIKIEDAISSVTAQNIVDGCYQGASLNTTFCDLFTRNESSASLQFGGFNFLQTTDVNFARIETSGYDLIASYDFVLGGNNMELGIQATKVNENDRYTNPNDLTQVNEVLGEIRNPEYAGNLFVGYEMGDLRLGWQAQYLGEQLLEFIQIETAEVLFDDTVFQDAMWVHNINANYRFDDRLTVYGGVKNLLDEDVFATNRAYPVSPRGRYVHFGMSFSF